MYSLQQDLSQLTVGTPTSFRNLTLFPLLRPGADGAEPDYLLAEDAMAQGLAQITELADGGSVPELQLENHSPHAVLLLDGEELLGAKQNRVLNLTILAPPNKVTIIPVSCVEAGRWHTQSTAFHPASHMMYARARAARTSQVTSSMRSTRTRRSDQCSVWSDIAAKASTRTPRRRPWPPSTTGTRSRPKSTSRRLIARRSRPVWYSRSMDAR